MTETAQLRGSLYQSHTKDYKTRHWNGMSGYWTFWIILSNLLFLSVNVRIMISIHILYESGVIVYNSLFLNSRIYIVIGSLLSAFTSNTSCYWYFVVYCFQHLPVTLAVFDILLMLSHLRMSSLRAILITMHELIFIKHIYLYIHVKKERTRLWNCVICRYKRPLE